MKKNKQHLIFEGAELVGKSFLAAQIYNFLEKKDNSNKKILNGCHWFNCDVGIFGGPYGKKVINKYIDILKILKNKNVIFEKFHLSDMVYNKLYNNKLINYQKEEQLLKKLNSKIILITVGDKKIFEQRIINRIKNVPHYQRIAQPAENYLKQQELYLEFIKKSQLKNLIIDFSKPLNKNFVKRQIKTILNWI